MPTYAAPGVYVEEVSSGSKPLSGVATAIAAFVGFTAAAPSDDPSDPDGLKPRLVTSWQQYETLYGGFAPGCVLPLSVFGFFQNGGTTAYIVRIPNTTPAGKPATKALPAADRALGSPVSVTSKEADADITISVIPEEGDGGEAAPPLHHQRRRARRGRRVLLRAHPRQRRHPDGHVASASRSPSTSPRASTCRP